jgi:hypothetical protein
MVDFLDLPVADIPLHNAGLTFDEAMRCLTVFARHESLAGLIISEFNLDHGAEDGSTTRRARPRAGRRARRVTARWVGRCGFGRWHEGRALEDLPGSVGLEGSGVTFDELVKPADGALG